LKESTMQKKTLALLALSLSLFGAPMVGCGDGPAGDGDGDIVGDGDGDIVGDGDGDAIDPALLAEYKRALPTLDLLEARPVTADSAMNMAVGDPAEAPQQLAPMIQGVNAMIRGTVETLEFITDLPPTLYNSDTREFLWGPFPDEDSDTEGDYILVYIKDTGEDGGEDFRYHYAFARGISNDVATFTPVIWGGSNPDPDNEDYGSGITLYDWEANKAFEDEHNPDHGQLTEGRFATVYAKGEDEDGTEVTWVVAAFRNFLPDDAEEGAEPIDVDHLYGHLEGIDEENNPLEIDFVNTRADFNIFPEDDATTPETWDIYGVGVNEALGRAETTITGGDLDAEDSPGSQVQVVECWDGLGARTYRGATLTDNDGMEQSFNDDEGVIEDCGFLAGPLSDLPLPTLDDLDEGLLDALGGVAENGITE
jgi:hypothetical protein